MGKRKRKQTAKYQRQFARTEANKLRRAKKLEKRAGRCKVPRKP